MRHDDPLPTKLEELEGLAAPQRRGREFEQLVAELFARAGFDVVTNARAAYPRQTDVHASDHREAYLIEAKWRTSRIGSADVEGVRARLRQQPSHVVGVIVTMGPVSEQALRAIESDRGRVIVILDHSEIRRLVEGSSDLRRLLGLKRTQLVVHGRASGTPPLAFASSPRDLREPLRLVAPDGSVLPWILGSSDYLDSCWCLSIADIDWVTAAGAGVTLDLDVPVTSLDELKEVINQLRALSWIRPGASWTIQQADATWSGFGPDGLLAALARRQDRYAELDRAHPREMLVFADSCPGGWYTVLADLDASSDWVQRVDISLQLVGVPDDLGELTRLRERLAIVQRGFFRPRTESSVHSHWLPEPIEVTPVAWVVEHDADNPRDPHWACGVAFANPLAGEDGDWPALVRHESLVIASLRSWHPLSEPRGRYVLERLEWAQSSDATLVRAIADW